MQTVSLARHAMATRFEILLHGNDAGTLRAAGEAALDEVERLENQLSLYRPGSEIAQLNARAAREAVRVTPEVFALLQHAARLSEETDGAFDITIAPLVRCWGFLDGDGRMPSHDAVAAARKNVGLDNVWFDPKHRTVRFARDGVMLDLGAIGKGYAVERTAEILREAGVTSGLIHGGTSTVCAIGAPPEADAWKVAVDVVAELERRSPVRSGSIDARQRAGSETGVPPATFSILLRDEALSVSAVTGRAFVYGERLFGHVIDPRTGQPSEAALLSAIVLPSATESDALSTALLTLGLAGQERITSLRPGLKTLVVVSKAGTLQSSARGF